MMNYERNNSLGELTVLFDSNTLAYILLRSSQGELSCITIKPHDTYRSSSSSTDLLALHSKGRADENDRSERRRLQMDGTDRRQLAAGLKDLSWRVLVQDCS